MRIRPFQERDRETLKEITVICFEPVSIDRNIEKLVGPVAGHDWAWRKTRHIDADIAANAEGVLVAEEGDRILGFITTRTDPESRIGSIPNLAVRPEDQKGGIGRQLLEAAFDHLRRRGMRYVRIETLDQNRVGTRFYPRMGFREVARQVHYIRPLEDSAPAGQ